MCTCNTSHPSHATHTATNINAPPPPPSKPQGIQPEVRTYNTIITACNKSGQPEEGLAIYERMAASGVSPSATTYTALISAYGNQGKVRWWGCCLGWGKKARRRTPLCAARALACHCHLLDALGIHPNQLS